MKGVQSILSKTIKANKNNIVTLQRESFFHTLLVKYLWKPL